MARKTKTIVVPEWGERDAGKTFLLTEMSAVQAERWGLRMFVALKGSGSEIPESSQRLGMVGVAFASLNAFLRAEIDPDILIPLFDELLTCVKMIRDTRATDRTTGLPITTPIDVSIEDIAEPATRIWLRGEVLTLHTGFPIAEVLSKWISASMTPPDSKIT